MRSSLAGLPRMRNSVLSQRPNLPPSNYFCASVSRQLGSVLSPALQHCKRSLKAKTCQATGRMCLVLPAEPAICCSTALATWSKGRRVMPNKTDKTGSRFQEFAPRNPERQRPLPDGLLWPPCHGLRTLQHELELLQLLHLFRHVATTRNVFAGLLRTG